MKYRGKQVGITIATLGIILTGVCFMSINSNKISAGTTKQDKIVDITDKKITKTENKVEDKFEEKVEAKIEDKPKQLLVEKETLISREVVDHKATNAETNINTEANTTKEQQGNVKSSYVNEMVGHLYVEGTVDKSLVDLTTQYLSYVPQNIMNTYLNDGWKIILTTKNIATEYYKDTSLGSIAGLAMFDDKQLVISARENAIKRATLHEFGHYVDYKLGTMSTKEDFTNAYNTDKNTLKVYSPDGHYKSNSMEFFAEVFQESILNPSTCSSTAPNAYNIIQNAKSQF